MPKILNIAQVVTQDYIIILALMFGAFLIGYFSSLFLNQKQNRKLINKLKQEVNALRQTKSAQNIETIFTEIKPKIVEVVKETQKEKTSIETSQKRVAERARTSYVNYTKSKPKLDFEAIGRGNPQRKDDLTKINGIGPYIEQKLNEIGIYNYSQIGKLNEVDIVILTEIIDFFPGRIERDQWVDQANNLLPIS